MRVQSDKGSKDAKYESCHVPVLFDSTAWGMNHNHQESQPKYKTFQIENS